jgi:hypothetical protein
MRGHLELGGESVAVESPELAYVQGERLRLKGHVCDGLTEVVERELRVLPVGVLDEAVRQVRDQHAGGAGPPRRTLGQITHQALVIGIAAAADDERPWLRVPGRRCPPRRLEQRFDLIRGDDI